MARIAELAHLSGGCPCGSPLYHSACLNAENEVAGLQMALTIAQARAFEIFAEARTRERGT